MKKFIASILVLAALFFTAQLFAQDIQTKGSGDDPKKMKSKSSSSTVNDTKSTAPNTQTVANPAAKPPEGAKQDSKSQGQQGTSTKTGITGTVPPPPPAKETGKILDPSGKLMATMDKDGWIRDSQNRVMGQYTKNGEYFNRNREKIGSSSGMEVFDKSGVKLGQVTKEGDVYDAGNKLIGRISKEGVITDVKGVKLGSAPGVDKKVTALLFFFQNQGSTPDGKQ